MGIDLYWDDEEQTVMLAEFGKDWTWDELHTMLNTIKRLSVERNQIFGAIIDVRNGLNIPGGSIFNREALGQFQRMLTLNDDGKGPVVIVGMSSMIRTVFNAVKQVDRSATSDVFFAANMDEARETIYREVANLNQASA